MSRGRGEPAGGVRAGFVCSPVAFVLYLSPLSINHPKVGERDLLTTSLVADMHETPSTPNPRIWPSALRWSAQHPPTQETHDSRFADRRPAKPTPAAARPRRGGGDRVGHGRGDAAGRGGGQPLAAGYGVKKSY